MKKSVLFFSIAIGCMLITSCSSKTSPEEQVRDYGKYFIEKISENQLDSLKATYPDIVKADSIVPVQSDTIIVVETSPGLFDVALAEGINLKLNHSEDGNISVVESRGLFAFPEGKIEIAKKTGLWNDSLTDASLAERMKDEDFFKYIESKQDKGSSKIITFSKLHVTRMPQYGMDSGSGTFTLTNHSNVPIKGSEYSISSKIYNERYGWWSGSEKGVDLPANGTAKLKVTFDGHTLAYDLKGVKWKIPESELMAKFTPFTGKEYQEYLDSKK